MQFALVVVEVSCPKGVGHLLRTKEEADPELCKIVTRLERQANRKVQILRSDNGTEFINRMEGFAKLTLYLINAHSCERTS